MCKHSTACQGSIYPDTPDGFSFELDHVIFYAGQESASCSLAEKLGLFCINRPVFHPVQGTASNLIFFENAYLEVVQVKDEAAAAQYARYTGMNPISRSRWPKSLASPFGIALRLQEHEGLRRSPEADENHLTVNTSVYFAPDNLSKEHEPICLIIPQVAALSTLLNLSSNAHQQLVSHPVGVRRITNIEITIPRLNQYSRALQMISYSGLVIIRQGLSPLLQLTLDEGAKNCIIDGRPDFPIIVKY